ncbi:hypothetical protein PINS_up000890 [Pythium insidiosum]|nr:hypothetical protein PINS_up000890 [Pythium insidiosum]
MMMFPTVALALGLSLSLSATAQANTSLRRMEAMEAMQHNPVRPYCQIEDGYDFVGQDIKNVKGAVGDCCYACSKTQGCKAWSWTDFNGGTCWLKSGRDAVVQNPNVKSALYFEGYAPACITNSDVDFVGYDIANAPSRDVYGCCEPCQKMPGCRAYSWSNYNGGTCWFKSKRGQAVSKPGVISAEAYPLYYGDATCEVQPGMDILGHDIGNLKSKDPSACCKACRERPDCKAYTWSTYEEGTCWFKGASEGMVRNPHALSAVVRQ